MTGDGGEDDWEANGGWWQGTQRAYPGGDVVERQKMPVPLSMRRKRDDEARFHLRLACHPRRRDDLDFVSAVRR